MLAARCLPGLVVALACAGCPASPGDDDPDGGDDVDGAVHPGGLVFRFETVPPVPGSLGDAHATRVTGLSLLLEEVRAVGDSSGGGDRTYRPELALEWGEGQDAAPLVFDTAPNGTYSRLDARLAAYAVDGTVVVDVDAAPFDIEDHPPAPIALSVPLDGATVVSGRTREVVILVELEAFVRDIAWETIEPDGDELSIGPEDPAILPIRARLSGAFSMGDTRLQ